MGIDLMLKAVTPTATAMLSGLVALLAGEEGFALLFLTVGFVLQVLWIFLAFGNR